MNAVDIVRNELLEELEIGIRSMEGLLRKVKATDWRYRPADNMRSLKELARHISAIPEVDLHLWQEKDQETIQNLEASYDKLESSEAMIKAMKNGFGSYKTFMLSLSDQDFLTKKTKPFYLEKGAVQAHWLVEEISHFFHHRGQLYNYLKQLGYDVNMFDLYV
ncbi:DinB family protein [Virgibacillus dakarensis]|uniref:DinB family protein n=1 Tax=Virgibacillus dakarensis TaxID=1917889 RepID=UPI000B43A1B3|nr:DinB family protein [Virgibacillus dakarensis]MTW87409.1 DinB family protein [Virgibacillus dakarensis]